MKNNFKPFNTNKSLYFLFDNNVVVKSPKQKQILLTNNKSGTMRWMDKLKRRSNKNYLNFCFSKIVFSRPFFGNICRIRIFFSLLFYCVLIQFRYFTFSYSFFLRAHTHSHLGFSFFPWSCLLSDTSRARERGHNKRRVKFTQILLLLRRGNSIENAYDERTYQNVVWRNNT